MGPSRLKREASRCPDGLHVAVERLVARGMGLARLPDGRVALVRGGFPGDQIRPLLWNEHRNHVEVQAFELLEPAPTRRQAPCSHAERCGGCDLMRLEPHAQRAAKRQLLEDVLRRTARLEPRSLAITWHAVGSATGYRSRIRVHLTRDCRIGFYSAASRQLVDIDHCLVASDRVNSLLARVRVVSAQHPRCFRALSELELRALSTRDELTLIPRPGAAPRDVRAALAELQRAFSEAAIDVAPGPRREHRRARSHRAAAPTALDDRLLQSIALAEGVRAWLAPGAFSQVNWEVNRAIISELLAGVKQRGLRRFADLYCGVGNFALPLLSRGLSGLGIENNPVAVALARRAALEQRLDGNFELQAAAEALSDWTHRRLRFELVIVDPPRAGMGSLVEHLPQVTQSHLFICACDPVPFARDLRRLLDLGFTLEALSVYEMFPQTHHVELVAWMRAPGSEATNG